MYSLELASLRARFRTGKHLSLLGLMQHTNNFENGAHTDTLVDTLSNAARSAARDTSDELSEVRGRVRN